jgi:predicted amidohydrolase
MENLRIATAQFEHANGNTRRNLAAIESLTVRAASEGAQVVAFHECCISGYAFARRLAREQMVEMAESIPGEASVDRLIQIARGAGVIILAGLFEKDAEERLFNAYVAVDGSGVIAKHRKIHPFISGFLLPGDRYTVFDLHGWRCGILTCYDNNVIENVRATTLLGAQIIFMPHVTACTPSPRPRAGFVDPKLGEKRDEDPTSLPLEFNGMKGRAWLMKWLPARAYDSGVYVVFSNAIGMDDDQLKNGCSMILDPFGDILCARS